VVSSKFLQLSLLLLDEIARNNAPFRVAIGQINTSIRALRHFQENRFPQPLKESLYRHTAGPAPVDPSKDRLEVFADNWIERMGMKPERESYGAIMRRLRNHPVNRDWDEEQRKVRERSVEQLG